MKTNNARFIYFGSSAFSRITLETLFDGGFVPQLVISQPDRPKGRGFKVLPTEVSRFAKEKDIRLITPQRLGGEQFKKRLGSRAPDYIIVADYGKIIPSRLLTLAKKFPLGLHPSLLPKYRGPAPINWPVIKGETVTGVTVFRITNRIDAGDIFMQKKIAIADDDDIFSLTGLLAKEGAHLLIEAIKLADKGKIVFAPQEEELATFARKLKKEDGRVSWNEPVQRLVNLVRGTLGWPSAYTYYKGRQIKLLKVEPGGVYVDSLPSTVVKIDKTAIYVATGKGVLRVLRLQPQDKRPMDAGAFARGARIKIGERLT